MEDHMGEMPAGHHDEGAAAHSHDMSGMAVGATLHCLTGCSIGEIIGLLVGTAAGWSNLLTTILSVGLAFVFGYSLAALPLVRGGNGAACEKVKYPTLRFCQAS